jgi:LPXTG-site transpeptidase (sortase) family protein
MLNPLFPTDDDTKADPPTEAYPHAPTLQRQANRIEPLGTAHDAAANIIRQKLATIYADAPDTATELAEAEAVTAPQSIHQRYMTELQRSGKDPAEIQTAWHNYYVSLSDGQKHEVWQEFYSSAASLKNNPETAKPDKPATVAAAETTGSSVIAAEHAAPQKTTPDRRTISDVKRILLGNVQRQSRSRLKVRDHLKSLGFGLASGFVVIAVVLFSFFNEIIIAPFIQPSRHVSAAPLIIDASTASVSSTPEVIIPKINVEIPVDYTQTSTDENVIENALESGVVHYPSTVLPGQDGNAAFFGHSSNNIFNPGKYKFAFVLLHTLVDGDTFYLTNNGKLYVYQVIDHKIVPPSDVSVLSDTEGHTATATLITCDPPGTSINRLVVTGVQISPAPADNSATPANPQVSAQPAVLPGNGPSLWNRFTSWIF